MLRTRKLLVIAALVSAVTLATIIPGIASAEDNGVIKIIVQPASGSTGWTNLASLLGIMQENLGSFLNIAHDNLDNALGEDVDK